MGAPFPAVPNCFQVNVQGVIPGEIWENTLHFAYLGPPPSVSNVVTLASGIAAQWSTHVSPLQGGNTHLSQVSITDLSSVSGSQGVAELDVMGGRAGVIAGANAAVLISYPVPGRYRGGKPRTYLLAGSANDLTNPMEWSSTFQSLVNTSWQAFINTVIGLSAGGTQITGLIGLRRHGKFLPNAGPPNYVLTTPIQLPLSVTDIIVHQQVASQKGRIGRRSK